MNGRDRRIVRAFANAAAYHQRANVQKRAARGLLDFFNETLGAEAGPKRPRVLELGCGSGFLSEQLIRRWPGGLFLFTDIAPEMVDRCRRHLAGESGSIRYEVLDGERISRNNGPVSGADVIAAGMVFQWFAEPLATPERLLPLLKPGGYLLFSTLLNNTFWEWRRLLAQRGFAVGVPDFADRAAWQRRLPRGCEAVFREVEMVVHHPSALHFLRELKEIGAHVPTSGHRPLSAGGLRSLLRELDDGGGPFAITHHLLYGVLRREEAGGAIEPGDGSQYFPLMDGASV